MGKPTVRLTDRDLRLLAKLGQMPALSTREIYQIFYSELAEKHAYRRLGQLVRGGYLLRYPYMGPLFGNTLPENRKITSLYALSARGALAASAGNAPRAFREHHWLYYFTSVLFADLVKLNVVTSEQFIYSGQVKKIGFKFQRWEPFHALVTIPGVRFYIYFLTKRLRTKFAGTLRHFSKSLYDRFRHGRNGAVRRYFVIVSPENDFTKNLAMLAVESILYSNVVTYRRAASIICGLSKDKDYYLKGLINRAGLPGYLYGDSMDVFRHYSTDETGRKIYLADLASGAISVAYKAAGYRGNIPVAAITWPEMTRLYVTGPKFEIYEID